MEQYDLVIVGAGPAGLSLARDLNKSNLKILLLDKKKSADDVQYITAGTFLNSKEENIPDHFLHKVNTCYLYSKNEKSIKHGKAAIINRRELLKYLEKEAKKNKNFNIFYKSEVIGVSHIKNKIGHVLYKDKRGTKEASAKIFVDCSSTSIILGKEIKLSPKYKTGLGIEYVVPLKINSKICDIHFGKDCFGGYGWVFPKSEDRAIVGFCTLNHKLLTDIESHLNDFWNLRKLGDRCQLKILEKNIGVLRTGKPPKKLVSNNVLLLGDTALQANPLVGEGIRFIIDSSNIAAKWILIALEKNDIDLLKGYQKEWHKKYYKRYILSYFFQDIMRKLTNNDNVCDILVKKINKFSDSDFVRMLSGDFDYPFFFKVIFKTINPF